MATERRVRPREEEGGAAPLEGPTLETATPPQGAAAASATQNPKASWTLPSAFGVSTSSSSGGGVDPG
eukprot:CAMPEP_0183443048 /NCGR_PEP_ID=MMETSP0370-20130417/90417_1 /TAXON_ID=268820 /ORGANISM="Peridinium aciculiferum, Strain PAER-2" /LENGTH=67 /DNA_ID=CAMNT_0025632901 /DNA_START=1 /DNA_END=200 /DNA_ORIENTATION=-